MITIDGPISFLAGAGLAVACADGKKIRDRDRTLYRGLLFQATVLTPIILYFMVRFPDWEWNYMFDARAFFFDRTDSPLGFVVLTVCTSLISAGFYLGFRVAESLLARGKRQGALRLLAGTGLLIGAIIAMMHDQALHMGSYAEYMSGTAPYTFTNVEFLIVQGVAGALIALSLGWIIRANRRQITA